MSEKDTFINARLKTPKAAAVAGIVFSLLMFTIFGLLRRSIPADPRVEPDSFCRRCLLVVPWSAA